MFEKNLKQLRKERNLTQTELALHLRVSLGAIGNWEAGNRTPDAQMLLTIADYFGVSTDRLLRDPNFTDTPFSQKEKRLISAYRNQPDIQLAVDRLLGVDTPLKLISENKSAALGGDETPIISNASSNEIASTIRKIKKEGE
ncbi:MAG: helix-turn-helix transcriptional regulator [Clostridia bacterium]|nr:helix-turn-helix transcriptional regulator [Clostridia bacterium]